MNKKKVIKIIRRKLRPVRSAWGLAQGHYALHKLRKHYHSEFMQKPHGLPHELIVSLTSYTPRFNTILPTLQCLLSQSIKPDRVILWVAEKDMVNLPEDVKALDGLEIRAAEDTYSYKKIIPALHIYPDAFIVTADDDAYYPPYWLEKLVQAWDGKFNRVVCHTAHRIVTKDGLPVPYNNWQWNAKGPAQGNELFFVGIGGVLYSPHSLKMPDVLDAETFLQLAPKADDVWLNWMARMAGSTVIKTGYNCIVPVWPESQKVSLSSQNTAQSANDIQIKNMIDKFGFILCRHFPNQK